MLLLLFLWLTVCNDGYSLFFICIAITIEEIFLLMNDGWFNPRFISLHECGYTPSELKHAVCNLFDTVSPYPIGNITTNVNFNYLVDNRVSRIRRISRQCRSAHRQPHPNTIFSGWWSISIIPSYHFDHRVIFTNFCQKILVEVPCVNDAKRRFGELHWLEEITTNPSYCATVFDILIIVKPLISITIRSNRRDRIIISLGPNP